MCIFAASHRQKPMILHHRHGHAWPIHVIELMRQPDETNDGAGKSPPFSPKYVYLRLMRLELAFQFLSGRGRKKMALSST